MSSKGDVGSFQLRKNETKRAGLGGSTGSGVASTSVNNKIHPSSSFRHSLSPSKTRSRSAPVSSSPGQLSGYYKVKPHAMLRYRIEPRRLTSSNLPSYFRWSRPKVSLVKTPCQRDLRTLRMERLNSHGQSKRKRQLLPLLIQRS